MSTISAVLLPHKRCIFSVWAPEKESMVLHIVHPSEQEISMKKHFPGYFSVILDDVTEGVRYFYKPEGKRDYPDPASHYQPQGISGPSEIVDHKSFCWHDHTWKGIPPKDLILYEIHVGTFSYEGTFEAIIPYLEEIASSGINALELMPVAQFPGDRNWGYDGVFPYSVQDSYGGPQGLKLLVDACHALGIAVFLDVVYNHLGPEGNIFAEFGPYFTNKYRVPWGDAINFDDEWSDGVREFFAGNPSHWFDNYHIDGVRVDAIHTIFDSGAVHFWDLIHQKIRLSEQRAGRKLYMIAESDFNSPRIVRSSETGGYNFDAQWLDDFHHALYVLLDKDGKSRYGDFGEIEQLAKAYTDGFVHSGEFVTFRKRKHGASSAGIPGDRFVAFNQNHDQIGNRVKGERLSVLVDFERLKLASAALIFSPYIPLLFMGEEYGEDNPFFYFFSFSDPELVKAVRKGRKKEFESYKWKEEPPDPQDKSTFNKSKIDRNKRLTGKHRIMLEWTKKLISIRRSYNALQNTEKNDLRIYLNHEMGFILHRKSENEDEHLLFFFNFSDSAITFNVPSQSDEWIKILDSKDSRWTYEEQDSDNFSSPDEIKAIDELTTYPCSVVVYRGIL